MDRRGFRFLEASLSWDGKSKFTLGRMQVLLEALGNPQNKIRSVHVTGSNGKGSVCAFVSAMLISSGYRVGQTSSPHLSSPCERCLINGEPVSEELLEDALSRIADVSRYQSSAPSYFETITAAAFFVFAQQELDYMVVEVGLGGRLDATNTMRSPAVCAVTSVSLEHTEILGPTLRDIAREKSGIFRAGIPVICSALPDEAVEEIQCQAARMGGSVEVLDRDFRVDFSGSYHRGGVTLPLPFNECALRGDYQRRNAAVACRIAEILGVAPENIMEGLRHVQWPGRLEMISHWYTSDSCVVDVLLDAAHNPEGVDALKQYLEKIVPSSGWNKVVFVFSALARKQWSVMLSGIAELREKLEISGVKSELLLTQSSHPHAVPSDVLLHGAVQSARTTALANVLPEIQKSAMDRTLIVIAGSMFLLADLRPEFVTQPFTTYRTP